MGQAGCPAPGTLPNLRYLKSVPRVSGLSAGRSDVAGPSIVIGHLAG